MSVTEDKKPKKYAVMHGHFYQPPRENPWLNHVELEPSAAPYHDWNERIAWECYIPNGMARINDHAGSVVDIVNNYDYLNFDFGPTLLNWYRYYFPQDYERILEAAEKSKKRLGRSNSIAHGYNHIILPLASSRDRLTQVLWGIADYEHRFKTRPESLWLPETACDRETLRILIDQKMRYVILSPAQAEKVRRPGSADWVDVSFGGVDTRRAYVWHDRDEAGNPLPGRSIALFFYDGWLSRAIAFEGAMRDSASLARSFNAAFDPCRAEDQLVHVATDGETYGHHHKFADLTLAHMFRHELQKCGIEITNYSAWLDAHPPVWEAEIKQGPHNDGTSWSCEHGVSRWKGGCDCGSENGQQQKWRAPLRRALDWLGGELAQLFETEGGKIFSRPWDARNDYINVIFDRSHRNITAFMGRHCACPPDMGATARGLKLLEMQKYGMYMFTSCGWFFSEVSRIETAQNLKYAARAVELAAELGRHGLEEKFLALLETAPSNIAEYETAAGVYRKIAKASRMSREHIIAEYGINLLFSETPELNQLYFCKFLQEQLVRKTIDGYSFAAAIVDIKDMITTARSRAVFCAVHTPSSPPRCYISHDVPEEKYAGLADYLSALTPERIWDGVGPGIEKIMGASSSGLRDLLPETRLKILKLIHKNRMHSLSSAQSELFSEYLPLVEQWKSLGLEVPAEILAEVTIGARQFVTGQLERFHENYDTSALDVLGEMLPRIKRCGLDVNTRPVQHLFSGLIRRALDRLETAPTAENARSAVKLLRNAREAQVRHWQFETQNRAARIFERWQSREFSLLLETNSETPCHILEMSKIYEELGIRIDGIYKTFAALSEKAAGRG